MEENKAQPNPEIASEAPQSLTDATEYDSRPIIPPEDYEAAEANLEALDRKMAGFTVPLSPNDILIERIPFSTEEHIRGHLG